MHSIAILQMSAGLSCHTLRAGKLERFEGFIPLLDQHLNSSRTSHCRSTHGYPTPSRINHGTRINHFFTRVFGVRKQIQERLSPTCYFGRMIPSMSAFGAKNVGSTTCRFLYFLFASLPYAGPSGERTFLSCLAHHRIAQHPSILETERTL